MNFLSPPSGRAMGSHLGMHADASLQYFFYNIYLNIYQLKFVFLFILLLPLIFQSIQAFCRLLENYRCTHRGLFHVLDLNGCWMKMI